MEGCESSCVYACLEEHYVSFLKFSGLEECIDCSGNGEADDCTKKLVNDKNGWDKFYQKLRIYNRGLKL